MSNCDNGPEPFKCPQFCEFDAPTVFINNMDLLLSFRFLKFDIPLDRFIKPVVTSKYKIETALEYATVDLIPPNEYTIEFWSRECKQTVIVH